MYLWGDRYICSSQCYVGGNSCKCKYLRLITLTLLSVISHCICVYLRLIALQTLSVISLCTYVCFRLIALAFSAAIGITFLVLGCALFEYVTLYKINDIKLQEPELVWGLLIVKIYHSCKRCKWAIHYHNFEWKLFCAMDGKKDFKRIPPPTGNEYF
jgi:hypothetical protein